MAILPPDPVNTFVPDCGPVSTLRFHNNDLLLGSFKGHFVQWDLQTNKENIIFNISDDTIINICNYDEKLIATQEKLGPIKLWNLSESREPVAVTPNYPNFCQFIFYNESVVCCGEDNKSIVLFELRSLQKTRQITILNADQDFGQITCFSSYDTFLWTGFENGHVILYDLQTEKQIFCEKFSEFVTSIAFDRDIAKCVLSNSSSNLDVFTYRNNQVINRSQIDLKNEGSCCVRIRRDKKIIVSGGWDNRIRIFSWKTLRPLAALTEHNQSITDVKFCTDFIETWSTNNLMAASSIDGSVSLWNLYN